MPGRTVAQAGAAIPSQPWKPSHTWSLSFPQEEHWDRTALPACPRPGYEDQVSHTMRKELRMPGLVNVPKLWHPSLLRDGAASAQIAVHSSLSTAEPHSAMLMKVHFMQKVIRF